MARKLRRSSDKVIAGVCAGIAERFDSDPTAIRVLWALLTVLTALIPGIITYIILWIVMPKGKRR